MLSVVWIVMGTQSEAEGDGEGSIRAITAGPKVGKIWAELMPVAAGADAVTVTGPTALFRM